MLQQMIVYVGVKMFVRIASFLSFVLLSSCAYATSYYVDCAGNNSNDGLTDSTPWYDTTNLQGTNFLQADDVVNIKKDCHWTGDIPSHVIIRSHGRAGHPITIQAYGSGADPIFDGSVDPTIDVPSWSGWTLYLTQYDFVITSASATAAAVYSNNGHNYTVLTTVSSSASISLTGVGAPTASGTLTKVSGTGDSTISFSSRVSSNTVWVSNVNIPWTPNTVIVDDATTLRRVAYGTNAGINNQSLAFVRAYRESFGISDVNQPIYVHMKDESDPNGHTFRFGRYQGEDATGLNGHDRGIFCIFDDRNTSYIDVNHIQVWGSNRFNFTSGAPYINFKNCTAFAASRENFYIVKNAVQNSTGAKYNTIQNSTSTYSNSNFGQNVTIESSHVDVIDTTVAYGWMAGIDWLDYNADTDASYGRCIRCIAHDNGRRAIDIDYNGFDPPGIYIDGGHDIQIIDSVVYMSDPLFALATANALFLLSIQTEHPDTKPSYNIDIINSLVYGSNFTNVLMGNAINCSGTGCDVCWNNRLIGSTVGTLGSGNAVNVGRYRASGPGVTIVNNVIGQNDSNKKPLTAGDISITIVERMDYNVYVNNTGTHTTGVLVDNTAVGIADLSLDEWRLVDGQDTHSVFLDPIYVGAGTSGGITQVYHLSSLAAGDAANSPGLALAYPNYLGTQYSWTSIGTVRTDAVVDSTSTPAAGYHYLAQFNSSTFLPRAEGSGTDYF